MNQKSILVVGAVGIAILIGVALVAILLFGSRAGGAPAGAVEPAPLEPPAPRTQRAGATRSPT